MDWSSCSPSGGAATISCIFPLISTLILWLLIFAGVIALFLVIFGGVRLLTSHGDAKTVEVGKKMITYAIVGLILVFLSFTIINLIGQITGVSCLSSNQPLSFTSCH